MVTDSSPYLALAIQREAALRSESLVTAVQAHATDVCGRSSFKGLYCAISDLDIMDQTLSRPLFDRPRRRAVALVVGADYLVASLADWLHAWKV
jgi:hypothetical protein